MAIRPFHVCALVLAVGASAPSASADIVRLQTGAELRGKIVSTGTLERALGGNPTSRQSENTDDVVIETPSGGRIHVAPESVAFVTRRPLNVEEYEVRRRHLDDSAAAHWELAQWCRENHMADEHKLHSEHVLALEPDREDVHRALGHVWKDGGWVDLDIYMTDRGYVKHKGRWITQQEFDLLEKTAAELQREQEWFPKLRLWLGWVTGDNQRRAQQGLQELQKVSDGDIGPAVVKVLGGHRMPEVRRLGVSVLVNSPGRKSAIGLATFALTDAEPVIRTAAVEGITPDQYKLVQPIFLQKLKSADNLEVNRAAAGLKTVGNDEAITPLINALITSHRYNVRVRGSSAPTYAFGTDGSFNSGASLPPAIEAGLRTGQLPQGVIVLNSPNPSENMQSKWVIVQQEQRNSEVLATLQHLTGENFGYDERTWHLWWAAQQHEGGLNAS